MVTELDLFVVHADNTIKEAVSVISANYSRCAIITARNLKVIGVVSEGDILRSLLEDTSLYAPIGKIARPSFRYLHKADMVQAAKMLRSIGVTLIPVVDQNLFLKDVITVHHVLDYLGAPTE